MVSKTPLGGANVEVTFRMPPMEGVTALYVSGDFNGWSATAAPMARQPDGSWVGTLVLEGGRSYRYRYCDDQGHWHTDSQADAYAPNSFGSDDSIVIVPAPAAPAPAPVPPAPREQAPVRAQPAPKKPSARRPAAKKKAEKPAGKKPAARKPAAKRPAAKKRAAKKPAARKATAKKAPARKAGARKRTAKKPGARRPRRVRG